MHKLLHSGEKDYSMKEKREDRASASLLGWGRSEWNRGKERKKDCLPRGLRKCKQGVGASAVVAGRRKGGRTDKQIEETKSSSYVAAREKELANHAGKHGFNVVGKERGKTVIAFLFPPSLSLSVCLWKTRFLKRRNFSPSSSGLEEGECCV